jgi:hypothetical protein
VLHEEAAQKFQIRGIPSNLVEHFWSFAEPYIKRALDHTSGEFLPSDLKRMCKDRVTQLWLVSEGERVIGAVTTEIVVYPQRKHCRVCTIGGSKAPEWTGLLFDIILPEWAKQQGCVAIDAYVRKGYVPILVNNYSFKHKLSVVVREIS